MARLPRWVALLIWPALFGTVHIALPRALARRGRRHGWRDGHPGPLNMAGLVPLGAGAVFVIWPLTRHYRAAPNRTWAAEAAFAPEYLLTTGPYRLTRHPMHVGGLAIWTGWAVLLGNPHVAAGTVALATVFGVGVRPEERTLERRFGDEWRAYAARTRRWL